MGYTAINGHVPVVSNDLPSTFTGSMHTCKKKCDALRKCNSFEHSANANLCQLLEQLAPTEPNYGDWQFCTSGIKF